VAGFQELVRSGELARRMAERGLADRA
jgi:hypothetical protein